MPKNGRILYILSNVSKIRFQPRRNGKTQVDPDKLLPMCLTGVFFKTLLAFHILVFFLGMNPSTKPSDKKEPRCWCLYPRASRVSSLRCRRCRHHHGRCCGIPFMAGLMLFLPLILLFDYSLRLKFIHKKSTYKQRLETFLIFTVINPPPFPKNRSQGSLKKKGLWQFYRHIRHLSCVTYDRLCLPQIKKHILRCSPKTLAALLLWSSGYDSMHQNKQRFRNKNM